MTGKNIRVIWSKRAIKSLKEIYDYYNQFSQKAAINQRDRILKKVSDIKFFRAVSGWWIKLKSSKNRGLSLQSGLQIWR